MATANPVKLHPTLNDAITTADVMFCKGGRIHEMFSGNVAAAMVTAYVLVREFTESQAGLDSSHAPLVIVGADPGEWSWWGFQGRGERTLTLPTGRVIATCYTTIAEHHQRATTHTTTRLIDDLANLIALWPRVRSRYSRAAHAEIRLVSQRLHARAHALPSHARPLLAAAEAILTHPNGAPDYAGQP